MRHITVIVAVVALALAAPAFSGKGGVPGGNSGGGNNGHAGGNGNGNGNVTVTYTPTVQASPNPVPSGDDITVSGCGFNPANGGVAVGFTGGSWGQVPDGNGCISIAGIPTVAGVPLPPGTYAVTAYQWVDGAQTEVAATTVTVVA